MKTKPEYGLLKVSLELKEQLMATAASLGLEPEKFMAFALKREILIFSKGGVELIRQMMACTECREKTPERKSLLVTIDLSQFEPQVVERLAGEAARKGVSLEWELTCSLLAWFGYISGDDAALKTVKCPGCGQEIKLPASGE